MQNLFTELLGMSIISSLLIVAVLILRLIFRKAPKAIICLLWVLVGIRLICPITLQSPVSVLPDSDTVSNISQYVTGYSEEKTEFIADRNVIHVEKDNGSYVVATEEKASVDIKALISELIPYVWAGGVAVMALISVISYIRLRCSTQICIDKGDNILLCDGIKSPFILGVIRPKIYVPSHLNEEEQRVVIAHEKAHIKRLDHLWKPLGYLILTIHWFNPLVWLAYGLLCRDIEGACDEKVASKMNASDKKLYSATLLSCSAPRYMLTACPVAFGEVSVKQRVRSVLNYKKPAFWIVASSLVVFAVVAVVFMTNPIITEVPAYSTEYELISQTILKENENDFTKDYFACESHEVLKKEELRNVTSYYMLVRYGEYSCDGSKVTLDGASACYPAVITLNKVSRGNYELMEYWEAQYGELYAESVKEKFPSTLHDKVFYSESYYDSLEKANERQAYDYFGVDKVLETNGYYPRFAGEVVGVTDEWYYVSTVYGNEIAGQKLDYVYVSRDAEYGGDTQFKKGDIITVSYEPNLEITDNPYLPDIKSLSLSEDVQDRISEYDISYYKTNSDENEFYSAYIDVNSDTMRNLEVYAYFNDEIGNAVDSVTESSAVIEGSKTENVCCIILDKANGFATFNYGYYTVSGTYEVTDSNLIINGRHNELYYVSGERREAFQNYVFHKVEGGYIFDGKQSPLLNTYYLNPENPDEVLNYLPDGALFTNEFLLHTIDE